MRNQVPLFNCLLLNTIGKIEFGAVKNIIVKNQYPICEFDTSKNPIIHPANFLTKNLPEKCVITYLRKELNQFVEKHKLPIIGYLNSEVFDIPIYEYVDGTDSICITMALCGGPGVQIFMRTFREMESVVEQYNRDLAEWEYQVSRKPTATAKEQHIPPKKQSTLKHLREIQERNKQKPPQRQRKKSIDRDSR